MNFNFYVQDFVVKNSELSYITYYSICNGAFFLSNVMLVFMQKIHCEAL